MKLPTSYLPEKIRSAVRFVVVGTIGMFLQTWLSMAGEAIFGHTLEGEKLFYTAFFFGYMFEVIPNYLFLNWYAFGTQPSWKNAGGFAIARVVNLAVQLGLSHFVYEWLSSWPHQYIYFTIIFIGGCINYLICLLFFKKKQEA